MSVPTSNPVIRAIARLALITFLASCATRNVSPIGANGQPFRPEPDERALWAQAEKEEDALLKKTRPYEDPLLDEYLARIVDRLLPDAVRTAGGPALRFGVIRDPTLNAFAMPNGRIYVHTGLLSRLDSEVQLATILGHEIAHITNRHAFRVMRDGAMGAVTGLAGVAGAASRASRGDQVGVAVLSHTARALFG